MAASAEAFDRCLAEGTREAHPSRAFSKRAVERGLIYLLTASSFIAFVEPSPYEFVFAAVLAFFVLCKGLRFQACTPST